MRSSKPIAMALGVVALAVSCTAGEQRYQVIVNSSRQIEQMSHAELTDYFLKQKSKWSDGTDITPVDLSATSAVRRSFTQEVLSKTVDSVLAHWHRHILSGRTVPPKVSGSEEAVIEFVTTNEGAIGYVSGDIDLPPGVKAVTVVGKDSVRQAR